MPGPVSDAYRMPPEHGHRVAWREDMRRRGFKYFVLKAADFLTAITDKEANAFNTMLRKNEDRRERQGKSRANNYWVVNRDEPYGDIVEHLIFGRPTPAQLNEVRSVLGLPE